MNPFRWFNKDNAVCGDRPDLLKDKICLITGASRGIGEQIAKEFAKRKAVLILVAQDKEKLQTVATECQKLGAVRCHIYSTSLFYRESVEKLANDILFTHKTIDVLVNNAGIAAATGMTALNGDPFEWEQVRYPSTSWNSFGDR